VRTFEQRLGEEIHKRYRMRFRGGEILEINTQGFTYLFDFSAQKRKREDRVLCVWGLSKGSSAPRDSSRMSGFLGGGLVIGGRRLDKGHLASHGQGGFEDGLNLFPQSPGVNRGHRAADPRYRKMERWCADHPGTFFFSRLLYEDETWVPREIEYGILHSVTRLEVRRFPN
jgi:hypothetical protein